MHSSVPPCDEVLLRALPAAECTRLGAAFAALATQREESLTAAALTEAQARSWEALCAGGLDARARISGLKSVFALLNFPSHALRRPESMCFHRGSGAF